MHKVTTFVGETFDHWRSKRASRMGAAISYYAIFSVAPLFILITAIVRSIFDRHTTALAISRTLNITIGTNLAGVIQGLINNSYIASAGTIATIIGGVVLIIAALSVLAELNNDLDELWSLPDGRAPLTQSRTHTVLHFIRERFISLFLILLCALLLLFSVAFTVLLSFYQGPLPALLQNRLLIEVINIVATLLITTVLFSLIYKILPDTKLPHREIVIGAFGTAILFLIGKFLISWYITSFAGTNEYGAAGSVVGLLLWIYYSAQVFFIGASGTFVYSQNYGYLSRKNTAE
ncbi:MAG: YihY/virulence factor BrkB family protein [Candidatus Paceibacterota bacterium]